MRLLQCSLSNQKHTQDCVRLQHVFKRVRVSPYIAQYPFLSTAQSAFNFISLAGLFRHHLNFSGNHPVTLKLMREVCSYKYPALSIARYSCIQLSELVQCTVKKRAQGLTPQHRIQTRVLLVERPKLYSGNYHLTT